MSERKIKFDYPMLTVVGTAARHSLTDSRLRKIVAISPDEYLFQFDRANQKADENLYFEWIISVNPTTFRILPWQNDVPRSGHDSHFAELLDHHLVGAKVVSVECLDLERIIEFAFEKKDYSGKFKSYRLIAELMGKYSNLILVDEEEKIVESHKPVHSYQSRIREIRPGKKYIYPPRQDRVPAKILDEDEWNAFLDSANPDENIADKILETFSGMSPGWSEVVCGGAEIPTDAIFSGLDRESREKLHRSFNDSFHKVDSGIPLDGSLPSDYIQVLINDFNAAIANEKFNLSFSRIHRLIDKRYKRLKSMRSALEKDLEKASNSDKYRKKADMIIANMYRHTAGSKSLEVDDWENPGNIIMLEVEPEIPLNQQANKLYQRYRKLKRTNDIAGNRLKAVNAELVELDDLIARLDGSGDLAGLRDVTDECIYMGLIEPDEAGFFDADKSGKNKNRQAKSGKVVGKRYRSNDGFVIVAGTSDKSNDALRRMARPDDMWLHVRDIPGSHVYILAASREIPDTTLREAAMVAVFHSKAKDGSNVPVDYTRAKYVTPISGAGLGKVNFRRERTIRVTPDESRIEMMKLLMGDERDS
ncbi:MAG TPA: NFACT family protein [bacterium]|jgi:predicted ribosome quality control (RQC) complex YloA/Tae2 family protein